MVFENIRNLREDHDLTQKQVAKLLHIEQTTYSKYELGKINIPIEVFITLADYYNTSINFLVDRNHYFKKTDNKLKEAEYAYA